MPRRPPPSTLFPYTTLFRSRLPFVTTKAPPAPKLATRERSRTRRIVLASAVVGVIVATMLLAVGWLGAQRATHRSEEHTSELQSLTNLVCRLLLEKKKNITN